MGPGVESVQFVRKPARKRPSSAAAYMKRSASDSKEQL